MGQVTIYLEDDIENRMIKTAKFTHLSKSKWIAKLINEKAANEWPQSVIDLAGSWGDFPRFYDLRKNAGNDVRREEF